MICREVPRKLAKSKLIRLTLFLVLCGVFFAIKSSSTFALSANWSTSSSGNWSSGGNWTGGLIPNDSADDATFNVGGSPNVNINGTFSVHNLIFPVGAGHDFMFTSAGGHLDLYGGLVVGNNESVAFASKFVLKHDVVFDIAPNSVISLSAPDSLSGNYGITVQGGGFVSNSDPVSYTGTTTITDGYFGSSGGDVFSPNSDFVLGDNAGAVLSACGGDQTIASLSGGAASSVEFCGARVTLGNALDTTYAGTMLDAGNGGGGITKVGTGKLTLTGTNTYTGATIVDAGTLDVNGSLTNSAVTVNSGGTLKGSGALKAVTINGVVAPGNSIGTLHVDTFELANGSTLDNEINPNGTTDLISATTSVTIDSGATLNVIPQSGTYTAGQTYTIISAPSITGTFSTITSTSSDLTYQLRYFATHVDLVVTPKNGASTASVNSLKAPDTGFGSTKSKSTNNSMILLTSVLVISGSSLFLRKKLYAQIKRP